jgi:hypothetical protein
VSRMALEGPGTSEVESGLRFRMLALMSWFNRFQGAPQ